MVQFVLFVPNGVEKVGRGLILLHREAFDVFPDSLEQLNTSQMGQSMPIYMGYINKKLLPETLSWPQTCEAT
jgi:hypothetical protein